MSTRILHVVTLFAAAIAPAFADTMNIENQCPSGQTANGPCSALFSTVGNAETLTIPTSIGNVTIQGGALFDDIANLPVDKTAVHGTAGNASNIGVSPGLGFTNPLTIIFPEAITGFSLDILNGNTQSVQYQLADNLGNSADYTIAPNFSSGLQSVGFAATGSTVTIAAITGQTTASGVTWDYLIDNINFNTTAPEPSSVFLLGIGLVALGLAGRGRRLRKKLACLPILTAVVLPLSSSSTASAQQPIALACPYANGVVDIAYSSSLAATGGVPPYTYSLSDGALPAGLILNASTGAISGTTVAAGTFAFTSNVVDSLIPGAGGSPDSASAYCSLAINLGPFIASLNPAAAIAGNAGFTLTVNGSGFTVNSVVKWNGARLVPTTFVSATQLTAPVSANRIAVAELGSSATITVTDNEMTSNGASFDVVEPWEPITNPEGVTFGQVVPPSGQDDPTRYSIASDWNTGIALIDFGQLGFTDGYIQVVQLDPDQPNTPVWAVQNFPHPELAVSERQQCAVPVFPAADGSDQPAGNLSDYFASTGGSGKTTSVAVVPYPSAAARGAGIFERALPGDRCATV